MAKAKKPTVETCNHQLAAVCQQFEAASKIENLIERYEALAAVEEQAKALKAVPAYSLGNKISDVVGWAGLTTMGAFAVALPFTLLPPLAFLVPILMSAAPSVVIGGSLSALGGTIVSNATEKNVPKKFAGYVQGRNALVAEISAAKNNLLSAHVMDLSQSEGFNVLLKKDNSVQKAFAAATLQKTLDTPEPARLPAAAKDNKRGFQL